MMRLHRMKKLGVYVSYETTSKQGMTGTRGFRVSLQGEKGECFHRVLLATLSTRRDAESTSMVAPSLSGKDERREPEVAEDEVERRQMPSVSRQPWSDHSNEINHHRYNSLGYYMLVGEHS